MQDLNDKVTGNTLTAAEWNEVPSEIQNVIEGLGIALSGADLNQLGKAIAGYVANGAFYTDGGAADAYVLTQIGSKQAPTAYTDGMAVEFIPDNTNTGASTVNVAGLGVKNIVDTGSAGLIIAGIRYQLRYRSGSGDFEIVNNQAGNAKVWVNFNGQGVVAIRGSLNVSSITDNGVGDYTVNYANNLPDINYSFVSGAAFDASNTPAIVTCRKIANRTVSDIDITTHTASSGGSTDIDNVNISIFAN